MSTIPIRFVCISDTFGQTPLLPAGDVLIHAGNLTKNGTLEELERSVSWIDQAKFQAKLIIAGGHDKCLDVSANGIARRGMKRSVEHPNHDCPAPLNNAASIVYLNHESRTIKFAADAGHQVEFKVFGSPFSSQRGTSAFGYKAHEAFGLWSEIPLDTDVVVSHVPAQFHCDKSL